MSAIFGIVHWDGRPVDAAMLDRMDAALAAHGPDGRGLWREGPAAFGHRSAWGTPEASLERQPLARNAGVLVCDVRIDNRHELAQGWSLGSDAAGLPDSAYVARALDAWHEEASAHLYGAFAFVHWDTRSRRLLLARSPFGERPLFYWSSPRTFAFATMPKGLFASGLTTRTIDEPFLADVLAQERLDPGGSYFRGVKRVPAGHVLVVTADSTRPVRVWRPERIRELRLSTDDAYVDAFLDVYSRAVRDVLRSRGRVGVMLSGGLDSSSVAAMSAPMLAARNERLAAFTEVPAAGFAGPTNRYRYADETPFVESVGRRYGNIDQTFIRSNGRFHLDHADSRFAATEAPVTWSMNASWWDVLFDAAREQGVGVLLNGAFGNFTVSYGGDAVISHMVGRGRWRAAWREARAIGAVHGAPAMRILAARGVMPWLPDRLYAAARRIRRFGSPIEPPSRGFAPIHPAFASQQKVIERARAKGPDDRLRQQADGRAQRAAVLARMGGTIEGVFAGLEARSGLEIRDPTADVRLAEFCLSLPENQFCRDGRRRWLIRRAMADRLPAGILDNRRRGLQVADWHAQLMRHRPRLLSELARIAESDLARRAIDLARLQHLIDALPEVDPGNPRALTDYRGVLEHGLEVGRFILWAESAS